ncbi:rod shape-determining protein MreC [candidate division WOR-3 bacterium]|nr:rod shape-determining protein MreC [candidate division WOR-3 bacterium]
MNRKTFFTSIILIIISSIILFSSKGLEQRGLKSICRKPILPFLKVMSFFSDNIENKHLLNMLLMRYSDTVIDNAKYVSLQKENALFRKMLELKSIKSFEMITAEILERRIDSKGYLLINKGIKDGVSVQMGVLFLNGIIGKIIETGDGSSIVETYYNINFRLSVTDIKGSYYIIARSNGKGEMIAKDLPNIIMENGDTLYTSGIGKLFPAGIPVGIIDSIVEDGNISHLIIKPFEQINSGFLFIAKTKNQLSDIKNIKISKTIGKIGWYQVKKLR